VRLWRGLTFDGYADAYQGEGHLGYPCGGAMSTDSTASSDRWLTIQEAAQRLGVSIATVRRRIKLGTLEAELQPGKRGPEYRVRLPIGGALAEAEDVQESAQTIATLLTLLEREQEDRRALQARLDAAAERLEEAAVWKVRAELLEAEAERLRAELERAQRRWWHRWFG
jgi:excisionase family DNA binding protein